MEKRRRVARAAAQLLCLNEIASRAHIDTSDDNRAYEVGAASRDRTAFPGDPDALPLSYRRISHRWDAPSPQSQLGLAQCLDGAC